MATEPKPVTDAVKPPGMMSKAAEADGNPALRMMGLPRLRAKLPSRNWLIFLSITGSFGSAVFYDRRQRKEAQRRWCDLVSHLAREPLPVNQLPRKFTIYLAAPPGDGLRAAREYFTEYVKPILVSAAIEWDVIEGRREGDVRAGLAERIRTARKEKGEKITTDPEATEEEDLVEEIRRKAGIRPSDELEGDIIIGRHTWKEYIRGLHEGWLGPLQPPLEPPSVPAVGEASPESAQSGMLSDSQVRSEADKVKDDDPTTTPTAKASLATIPAPKPIKPTPPYISPSDYPTSVLASTIPRTLPPTVPLPFPYLLGFLNTPIRIYRFLTQRYLTDEIGRMVADMVLADSTRPWERTASFASSIDLDSPAQGSMNGESTSSVNDGATVMTGSYWEQQKLYREEENEWHKSARAPNAAGEEGKERVWQEDMIIDDRIGDRMTTIVNRMSPEDKQSIIAREQTAELAAQAQQAGWGQRLLIWTGWREDDAGRVKGWEHGYVGHETD